MEFKIDYNTYNMNELIEAFVGVDASLYPQRAIELIVHLSKRTNTRIDDFHPDYFVPDIQLDYIAANDQHSSEYVDVREKLQWLKDTYNKSPSKFAEIENEIERVEPLELDTNQHPQNGISANPRTLLIAFALALVATACLAKGSVVNPFNDLLYTRAEEPLQFWLVICSLYSFGVWQITKILIQLK